ncbi:cupin domain-containing protein [Kitasatospora sp. NPDC059327]|uniref:cupin domain-containing protein n=1 Tax=Kitasatospora sp. NPDC059327 TaxID=3346803 RepID=UPI0036C1BCF1
MTTLASPTQGGSALALWRVEMASGGRGPLHVFDVEQVWTVLTGDLTVELGGEAFALAPGDTAVLPAGVARRISAGGAVAALVAAPGGARVSVVGRPEEEAFVPGWIA